MKELIFIGCFMIFLNMNYEISFYFYINLIFLDFRILVGVLVHTYLEGLGRRILGWSYSRYIVVFYY